MSESAIVEHPRQPLLNDAVVALRAPTQVWSGGGGDLGESAIHGVYHGDTRQIREHALTCGGSRPEWISVAPHSASHVVFGGLLRGVDDDSPDPKVRILRSRTVEDGRVQDTVTITSHAAGSVATDVRLRLVPEFAPLQEVKAGLVAERPWNLTHDGDGGRARVESGDRGFTLTAPGATISAIDGAVELMWPLQLDHRGSVELSCELTLDDPSLVVHGARHPAGWTVPEVGGDPRLNRWLRTALGDLDALRLTLPDGPDDEFFAAGAPWFLTLFGRDSLWAARLALPLGHRMAASTLRVLARFQGERTDPESAQQPGKILHELRGETLAMPGEGIVLPPVYYGTVDATALWICLLADAWRTGMPEAEVRDLLPALRSALDWLLEHGDGDADGFIDYIDETGHGLANQGWKDSGDSIQWRSGELAEGPIALCEVQGYAYEAAVAGAELLDHFGEPGAARLREWAAELKQRFAEFYWVSTPEGRYPAIALDARKRPVDTLTSNIGHLLGTGILDPADEKAVAAMLVGPSMLSGYGVRTMSTDAGGYWPLSYHGGSVWTHDTAIIARGMALAGLTDEAELVVDGMLAAAEGFGFRVPELHSGDSAADTPVPTPYPAACRPQAWSAAAAITAADIVERRRGVSRP
ncbi:Amylo-alpha-1,6-glucosidase [Microbacterium sp. cf046]|uniref:glycogen debranching N-terminal domain-containing protein n=1 Tax=Microbacterium sp. cf046 TaxID=1761803 RepID=UPI0008E5B969|nr:glycogen debranching N-terminal domain-containing protein [Microbacterium sp. cf046]SFS17809.1 Amylo-alpha-1,6-glucosidase [Microbacterium sp. cf046]